MQGKSDAATHDEYIERLTEPRRGEIRALHELIRRSAPRLEPTMEFGRATGCWSASPATRTTSRCT